MEIKKRTHVVIPEEFTWEVDRLSGKRKRSKFIAEAIKREIYPGKGRKYCINDETLKKYKVLSAKL